MILTWPVGYSCSLEHSSEMCIRIQLTTKTGRAYSCSAERRLTCSWISEGEEEQMGCNTYSHRIQFRGGISRTRMLQLRRSVEAM